MALVLRVLVVPVKKQLDSYLESFTLLICEMWYYLSDSSTVPFEPPDRTL